MNLFHTSRRLLLTVVFAVVAVGASAQTQTQTAKPFEPQSGQPGKDVVWVPTPQPLVDKMLDLAKVTAQDYVIDLGSGDGRTVITAAKRGATAHGIEYNPDMVALSQRNAAAQGVTGKATFAKADLFETDFSKATVITMFLLPSINMQLRPKILDMKPGTRIVSNAFDMEDWQPDETGTTPNCTQWCKAMLWIVPAKVGGHVAASAGRPHAHAEVSDAVGNAGVDADRQRQAAGRPGDVRGRQRRNTPAGSTATRLKAP